MRPLLDPSYFHARLLSPKDSYFDYSTPLISAEVPFRNENGQNRQRLALISYKEEPDVGRFARATRHAKGAVFTTPLKNTQIEAYGPGFLRLERMLGPQRPVAIAATQALRPPDSRGAIDRFYMRNFYILIYFGY